MAAEDTAPGVSAGTSMERAPLDAQRMIRESMQDATSRRLAAASFDAISRRYQGYL